MMYWSAQVSDVGGGSVCRQHLPCPGISAEVVTLGHSDEDLVLLSIHPPCLCIPVYNLPYMVMGMRRQQTGWRHLSDIDDPVVMYFTL